MPRFILNRQQYDGHHEAHNASVHCNSKTYPAPENQIDLGYYDTCSQAITAAKMRFPQADIDGCYFCTSCHKK